MAGADLAGILLVVVEVLGRELAALVAQQTVRRRLRRIELYLQLHVLRHRVHRAAELGHEHLFRLEDRIDERIVAVARVGETLHHAILVVAVPDAEHRKEHAAFALRLDEPHKLLGVADPDVEIAVRHQDHAVVRLLVEVLLRLLVRQLETFAARRAAAAPERVDDRKDLLLVLAGRRREAHLRAVRVGDDGDRILRTQLVHEHVHGRLEPIEPAMPSHRSRNIKQEHEIGGRQFLLGDALRLDADAEKLVRLRPRTLGQFAVHRDGNAALRLGIRIVEVVHILLKPHGILRRQTLQLREIPPHRRVARRIHVKPERRKRFAHNLHEFVLMEFRIPFTPIGLRAGRHLRRDLSRLRRRRATRHHFCWRIRAVCDCFLLAKGFCLILRFILPLYGPTTFTNMMLCRLRHCADCKGHVLQLPLIVQHQPARAKADKQHGRNAPAAIPFP